VKKNSILYCAFASLLTSLWMVAPAQKKEPGMNEMWGKVASTKAAKTANAEWFQNAKYAMFIHWGLFSQAANMWREKTYYGIGEWLMYLAKARVDEYEKLANEFNPVKFDAKEWVQLAKDAGMKYIVITAKHHEGFAMFKSANPYNIVDATPFQRDPMKELAVACKEAGIKLGFYYSQFQDWHEINGWSRDLKPISFEQYFRTKCEPQVKELLTNYGPLTLIWFDTPGEMTKEQSLALVNIVKARQPEALINSRIGNGVGDYSTYGDHEIPSSNVPGLWEAVNTSNDSWGYAWYDENWKEPTEIATDLVQVVARGGNFMLNIGPRADGTVPEISAAFLRKSGGWIKQHGDAIYGAKSSPWLNALPWGDVTQTGNNLNLFVFDWKAGEEIWLPGLKTKIKSTTIKTTKEKLFFRQDADGWAHIQLPLRKKNELIEVVTVELAGTPEVDATLGVDPSGTTTILADFAQTAGCRKGKSGWMEKFGEWKHKTNVGNWESDTSSATWNITVKKPGLYVVNIEYNAWIEGSGGEWDLISGDGDKLRMYTTETTGSSVAQKDASQPADPKRPRYRNIRMGIIEFKKAGKQTLKFAAAAQPKGGGIDLHAMYLSPVE
jgi:alpha-L-fucosidase